MGTKLMDNLKMLELVERYLNGQMDPEEQARFETLRKTDPEVDQLVVEHTFFLQQIDRFGEIKNLKTVLNDVHMDLADKGTFQLPELKGKAKVIYLFHKFKRTAAIAASIACVTALGISALVTELSPAKPAKQFVELSREINGLKNHNKQQDKEITIVKNQIGAPAITYKTGGTGFLIDTKGYIVTNAHIIERAKHIAVQNSNGHDLHISVVFVDAARDLAILKIDDTAYKAPGSIPYSIKRNSGDIAEPVFTLGFPRNDIVYGEGYLSAKTGFNGDTLTCQIAIAANPGNSGGPILNRDGEVIGVLSAKQVSAEGVVFATQSKFIYNALNELKKDTAQKLKIPSSSSLKGMDRTQQVKKITDYIYMVKVN